MKPFFAVFLPLLIAYGITLGWVMDRWDAPTQYYQHGWLLPFVAFAVIWMRRAQWRVTLAVPDPRAWWLLGAGMFLHLAGALLMIDSLSATSLVLTVPGAAWLALGRQRLRDLWPVLFLVLFAVPPPMYVEGWLGFTLKEFAVGGGAALANLLGAAVTRAGSDLRIDGTDDALFVAEACGGLRSLMAMITLGYCIAFLIGSRSATRRIVLMLATVPLAVGANVVRIAILCLMGRWFGVEFAEGTGHTMANVGEWVFDVGALLLLDAFLSRRAAPSATASAGPPAEAVVPQPALVTATLRRPAIVLWLLSIPLLLLSLYRPSSGGADRAARLPAEVAGFHLVPRSVEREQEFRLALPRFVELLGTDDFVWREYRDQDGYRLNVVALYHDTNWKSVHPPRICIEGSNMAIVVDDLVSAPWLDSGTTLSRIVAKSNLDQWEYLTLSVFGTVDWASGSYSEFSWHHLPRALLRQSQSGFLFRVETPVPKGETHEVAQQRCVRFLRGILPAARELLR